MLTECLWSIDQRLFTEAKSILKKNSNIFIVEPLSRVTKKEFRDMINLAERLGFSVSRRPKIFLSRSVILKIK